MADTEATQTANRGLHGDVAADFEAEEGPPSQGHHGEDRTNIPAHADREGHGPKTTRAIRETINRQRPGGTH